MSLGIDVVFERCISTVELKKTLIVLTCLKDEDIEVVDSLKEYPTTGAHKMICLQDFSPGEFKHHVAIDFAPDVQTRRAGESLARGLAILLSVRVLIPDADVNPYTMMLVNPDGSSHRISLDAEKLDSLGEYWVNPITK